MKPSLLPRIDARVIRTQSERWLRLGSVTPTELVPAREELHWALQIPAAAGIQLGTPREDYGHHALTWSDAHGALLCAPTRGPRPHRAGLRLATATLFVLDEGSQPVESLALDGLTLAEGFAWLQRALERRTGRAWPALRVPDHELFPHALAQGAPFGEDSGAREDRAAARAELACWFEDLTGLLGELRAQRRAGPLRIWSHHFDLDTVLELGPQRRLGLGFSPGDEGVSEPYLYALPDPAPEQEALPALVAPFEWSDAGWVGGLLRGSRLAKLSCDEQAGCARRFYAEVELAVKAAGAG